MRETIMFMQTHAELRARTQEVLEFLKAEGVRLHARSRFQQYLKQFDAMSRADGVLVPTGFDLRTWHRSLLELNDLHLIVNELCRPPEVRGWRKALQQIVSGEPVPVDEVKHSRSRDVQFELVTAAMLRAGGYEVELAEPDVVVKVQKRKYGIAAKRPRSFGNLDKLLKDAGAQIARSGRDGFIALDLSALLNPLDQPITASVFDSALQRTIKTADSFLSRNATRIRHLIDHERTFGVMAHFGTLVIQTDPLRLGFARRWSLTNMCDLKDRRAKFLKLAARRMPGI